MSPDITVSTPPQESYPSAPSREEGTGAGLPRLSVTEALRRYRTRVNGAKRWREDEKYDDVWERLRDVYRLKHFEGATYEDRIAVAIGFATINVIAPSVAVNHPKFIVNARDASEDDQATIAEAVINYWFRHYNLKTPFQRAIKDWLIYGHGWLKVGYRYREDWVPRDEAAMAAEFEQLRDEADTFAEERPELAGDLPTDEEIALGQDELEPVTLEDRPFVERVSPFDMYVDPESTCLEDATWVAQKLVVPLEQVKHDPRFSKSARRALKADGSVKWHNEADSNRLPEDIGRVTLWEFYDLTREQMCVFADSQLDKFLLAPQPLPYEYGLPFLFLNNYEVPDQFYGIGELEALEPLQHELNEVRSAMVGARKLDKRKFFYRRHAFTPDAVSAMRSSEDNVGIPVEDDRPFADLVAPFPRNEPNAQLYQHSEVVEHDIDTVSGVSEYQRGSMPEVRRTATEASIIQDQASSRAAEKLDRVELFLAELGRRLLQLAQTYMTGEQTVRTAGVDGTKVWTTFAREDIAGEFDFEVEAGSTQPRNDTFRRQQALQLMNAIGPLVGAVIDPAELARHVLRDGFGIKNPERFILPPAPPQSNQAEKLIETINYKDVPPDIRRQMEAEAGFIPSRIGDAPFGPDEYGQGGGGAAPSPAGTGAPSAPAPTGTSDQPNGGGALGPGATP